MDDPAGTAYISGPMTGQRHYGYATFMGAAHLLEAQGWQVVTPFEANNRAWQRHFGRPFDPVSDSCEWGDPIMAELFAEDVHMLLLECDAIVLLPRWWASTGASIELLLAWLFDKQIFRFKSGDMPTIEEWRPGRGFLRELARSLSEALARIYRRKERKT